MRYFLLVFIALAMLVPSSSYGGAVADLRLTEIKNELVSVNTALDSVIVLNNVVSSATGGYTKMWSHKWLLGTATYVDSMFDVSTSGLAGVSWVYLYVTGADGIPVVWSDADSTEMDTSYFENGMSKSLPLGLSIFGFLQPSAACTVYADIVGTAKN